MNDLVDIFENANKKFLSNSLSLLNDDVSERTLCGTLGQYLDYETKHSKYNCYYVDTEYNRNAGRVKTFYKDKETIVPINCDLIVSLAMKSRQKILIYSLKGYLNRR